MNHISNYNGKTSIHGNFLLASGPLGYLRPDLVISIGGQLGDYALDVALKQAGVEHWRVREDGSFCDTYNSLSKLFECSELYFFVRLAKEASEKPSREYFDCWQKGIRQTRIPDDLPLSHALIAQRLSPLLPGGTNLHFGILSSLRSWELVSLDRTIKCYANVAGFGIDGSLSTFLGQSVASESLCVLVIGDLSFFYDMNAIGNRHVKSNVRIILVNNSGGCEFRMYRHTANQFGEAANRHIAAAGHFGESAGGWVKNNRFEYLAVTSKDDLDLALMHLLRPSRMPIVLEVHTKMEDESHALKAIMDANDRTSQAERMTRAIKSIVPRDLKEGIKRLTG